MLYKLDAVRLAAKFRAPGWHSLTELMLIGGHEADSIRQMVDVLHWTGVIRSRSNPEHDELYYEWIR